MALQVRALDKLKDRRSVEAIDTSFETDTIFDLVTRERSLRTHHRPPGTLRWCSAHW